MEDRRLDFEMLQTFCEVAQSKSIREAALNLHVTPSCVSRRLSGLEEQMSVELIQRSHRAVRLSEDGQAFLPFAQRCLGVLHEGYAAVAERRRVDWVVLGATPTVSFSLLPAVLQQLARIRPRLSVRSRTAAPAELFELVLDQAVSIALTTAYLPHPDLSYEPVYDEEVVAVASPSNMEAILGQTPMPLIHNVSRQGPPWPGLWTDALQSGRFRVAAEVEYQQVAEQLACRGFGVTFLPVSVARASIERGALVMLDLPECRAKKRTVYLLTARSSIARPLPEELISQFRAACLASAANEPGIGVDGSVPSGVGVISG